MRLVSAYRGELQVIERDDFASIQSSGFTTQMGGLDRLLPPEGLAYGAVHEVLSATEGLGLFFTALLAKIATDRRGFLIWSDRQRLLYPLALRSAGINLERLLVLHPKDEAEEIWAVGECMRCRGVGATVAMMGRLSHIQARRLQLA